MTIYTLTYAKKSGANDLKFEDNLHEMSTDSTE